MIKYIIGNWKMSITRPELSQFVAKFATLERNANIQFGISAPFVFLDELTSSIQSYNVWVGAQNVSEFASGAYTGEVSASMLSNSQVQFCLVGHSERRHIFGETNSQVNQKISRLLESNIQPLLCIGETLEEFQSNATFDVLSTQIQSAFDNINLSQLKSLIIAYEPVWAIGTGKTPTLQEIQNTIQFIKKFIQQNYQLDLPILYGGSVKPANASSIISLNGVDGALIGGASLNAQDFVDIANATK